MPQRFRNLTRRHLDVIETRAQLAAAIGDIPPAYLTQLVPTVANHYRKFTIRQRSGGNRDVQAPSPWLRGVQRRILDFLYERIRLPSFLYGGLPRRSVVGHATQHRDQPEVITIDVARFFPSTTTEHIRPLLAALGFRGEALTDLLALVTLDGVIPQGAPSSSLLANLAFFPVDLRIQRICHRHDLRYSRFVDDIALSGRCGRSFLGPLKQSIEAQGFHVADHKTLIMPAWTRQIVTGIVVNSKLRPTRQFVDDLRADIRECLDVGALAVAEPRGIPVQQLKAEINGRVNFVRQCDGTLGQRLKNRLYGIDWSRTPQCDRLPVSGVRPLRFTTEARPVVRLGHPPRSPGPRRRLVTTRDATRRDLKGILAAKVVDEDLRSDKSLTMALVGLMAEDNMLATRIVGKYRRRSTPTVETIDRRRQARA